MKPAESIARTQKLTAYAQGRTTSSSNQETSPHKIHHAYVSPLQRAQDTIEIVLRNKNIIAQLS